MLQVRFLDSQMICRNNVSTNIRQNHYYKEGKGNTSALKKSREKTRFM